MAGTRSTNGRDDKCSQPFRFEDVTGGDHFEHLEVDERIILKWMLRK
jgi:hypothetical protein